MSGNAPSDPQQPNGPQQPGAGQPPQYGPPQYQPPQPQGPQPQAPQPQGPQYRGPQYQAGQYQGPQYQGPQNQGPQYGPPQPDQGATYQGPQYGPPSGPQQPGQPNPYGSPAQPNPYQGGPQQPKKSNTKVLIIVGAVVLALIVVAIGVGVVRSRPTAPTTDGGPGGTGTGTTQAPPAAKQSDAVKAYLEALASGKADAVIATLDKAPVDKTFMTDAVLAQSIKLAPLTAINVSEPTSEYDSSIDATYKLGTTAVKASISVVEQGDGWRVREGYNELDLSYRKARTLPMLINGVAANTAKIRVFPGAYQFTTGAKYISYGDQNTLTVESPSDYPRGLTDIEATLSSAGEKAFIAAVKDSVETCLKSKNLKNANCPNNVSSVSNGYKPKAGTIKWRVRGGSPYANMKVRLDSDDPTIAESYIYLRLQGESTDCGGGSGCTITPYSNPNPQADMTQAKISVKWVR